MNKKIKVAHIVTNFALGGAQDYLITTIKNLDSDKFELFIFSQMQGERIEELIKLKDVTCADVPALSRDISPLKDLIAIFQIFSLLKKYKINLVHTHSSKAGVVGRIAAKLADVGVIVHTIHGFPFHDFMTKSRRKAFILLERLMARLTDALLLVSEKEKFIALNLNIKPNRIIETIYNSVDFFPFTQNVDREIFRRNLGVNSSEILIGFSGRFSQQKALHILLDAFSIINKEFPQTRLLLVGDGVLKSELVEQSRKLEINDKIIMTGFQYNVAPFYLSMDIFIMTSLWEGLSRCLAEAMYAKLPVIATDVGGTADAIVNNQTGWLIKPNDVNAAVNAMRDAILNPEICKKMGENGFRFARESFDIRINSKRISELYVLLSTK